MYYSKHAAMLSRATGAELAIYKTEQTCHLAEYINGKVVFVNREEETPVCQRGSLPLTHFGARCCAFHVRESSRLFMGSLETGIPAVAMLVFRASLRSQDSFQWHS